MKLGDLVTMPGSVYVPNEPAVGVIIDDKVITTHGDARGGKGRVGVTWLDGGGRVDYEPASWLEVISESR